MPHLSGLAGDTVFTSTGEDKAWERSDDSDTVLRVRPERLAPTRATLAKVLSRGNRLVPEVSRTVCDRIGTKSSDIDVFVTNQPNRLFLRNWHEALELPADRHPDTFDAYGNLFAAGIPITLDTANRGGRIAAGSTVLLAAFAHAGDFAAAAAIRWGNTDLLPPHT